MSQEDLKKYLTPGRVNCWTQDLDSSMGENYDPYITPDPDNNTTQFFSVLEESSAETVEDNISQINLETYEEEFINSDVNFPNDDENQNLVIFKVPHSDKMYGLQTALDEDGNLRKYQYEVIINDQQQFETVPGTIRIVPFHTSPESVVSQIQEEEFCTEVDDHISEQVFVKEDVLDIQEEQVVVPEDTQVYYTSNDTYENSNSINEELLQMNDEQLDDIHDDYDQENPLQIVETEMEQIDNEEGESPETDVDKKEILHKAMKGMFSPPKDNEYVIYSNEEAEEPEPEYYHEEEESKVHLANIAKERTIALYPIPRGCTGQNKHKTITTIQLPNRKAIKCDKLPQNSPLKTLNTEKRTNTPIGNVTDLQKENLQDTKPPVMSIVKTQVGLKLVHIPETKASDADKKVDKKKIVSPWNVNKMISQTTIIEAPVRQERLPRKQKIEPLSRVGDELVFQHVTVSANGVVETKVDGVIKERKIIQPSECIQLSDSDEDGIRRNKKRGSKKKPVEIIISDSEDDALVKETEATQTPLVKCDSTAVQTSSDVIISTRPRNNCSKCLKSFPSVGSLKTHMQFHTLEENKKKAETKHRCSQCNECFINHFLLSKHELMHKSKNKFECTVCLRLFNNQTQLNNHKATHNNNEVTKQTIATRKSQRLPTKPINIVTTRNANIGNDITKQVSLSSSKICISTTKRKTLKLTRKSISLSSTTTSNTNTKAPSHLPVPTSSKGFKCQTCNSEFPSKVLLDSHIINNCVKSRKSTMLHPRKSNSCSSISLKSSKPNASVKTNNTSIITRNIQNVNKSPVTPSIHSKNQLNTSHKDNSQSAKLNRTSRRIPANAGIRVSRMTQSFVNMKRKFTEDAE